MSNSPKREKRGRTPPFIRFAALLAAMLLTLCACSQNGENTLPSHESTTTHIHTAAAPASCESPSVCSICGAVLAPATGHTPGDAADCTHAQVCTVCGKELAPATGHTPAAPASCTEPSICSVCGAEIEPALGHDPTEATCTEPSVCKRCGEQLEPALGHSYETQSDGSRVCSRCGDRIAPPTTHNHTEYNYNYVPETQNYDHYHQTLTPYYGGAVLVCGDYGLEYFQMTESGYRPYADAVNAAAEKYPGLTVSCMIVPKLCAFEVPEGYTLQESNQRAYINATYAMMDASVHKIDALGAIAAHKGEYMYYRTDHHWTSLGAYYAFTAYCADLGLSAPALSAYQTDVNMGYVGSLYKYSGNASALKQNPDYTVVRTPLTPYTLTYTTDGVTHSARAVNSSATGYAAAFINGDQGLTVIKTENHNGRKVIVFKESFGNALAVYLIDCFEEVYVVDVRMKTASIEYLIGEYGITDILVINNIQATQDLASSLRSKLLS